MTEESQVSGCYNFYLHQPRNSVGSPPESDALVPRQQLKLNDDLLLQGHWGKTGGKRRRRLVECCFTSTETVGLLGTGAQDGHLDFHTAPVL